jgi:predicted transcriptional regulator
MTMLRGTLVVHGADLEKLARSAIRDSGLRLSWDREEELLTELVLIAWELSQKHDERRYPGGFAKGCDQRLRFRVIDWIRKTEGRTRWQFGADEAQRIGRRYTREVEQTGSTRSSSSTSVQRYSVSTFRSARITTAHWERLSPRSLWTLQQIATRLSAGLSIQETARQVGLPRKNVEERLDELAAELLEVSEVSGVVRQVEQEPPGA